MFFFVVFFNIIIIYIIYRNVIDVAALGSHNMEQHEYLERMNQYHSKIALVAGGSWQNPVKRQCLLIDIPNAEKVLSNSAISSNNFIMVRFLF
jgi:hypothetical protein